MRRVYLSPTVAGLLLLATATLGVAAEPPAARDTPRSAQSRVDVAVRATLEQFRPQQLQADQIAVTFIDLHDPAHPDIGRYRGEVPTYPASVVKLFYLAAAQRWLEEGKLADTPELRRALRDMIIDSSNDATGYVVDLLTSTTSGPELPERELAAWFEQREAVNRYFASLGYTGINVNKKPWGDGPYGRETQAMKTLPRPRNQLTTDATAQLLADIALRRCVSPARSEAMLTLLRRDLTQPDEQARFSAAALPPGTKLWSKAGWTSQTRHDALYLELPTGARFVLVVFTVNHASDTEIIPILVRALINPPAGAERGKS